MHLLLGSFHCQSRNRCTPLIGSAIGSNGHFFFLLQSLIEFKPTTRQTSLMIQMPKSMLPSIPSLTDVIDEVHVVELVPGRSVEQVERLPDGTVSLLFRVIKVDAASNPLEGDLIISGPRTHALYKTVPSIPLAIFVRFRPGSAFPIAGVAANELTNRIVSLEELWGSEATRLRDKLLFAPRIDQKLELLRRAFQLRAARNSQPSWAPIARRALHLMTENVRPPRVNELAASIGVSTRHLRRTFTALIGISPKEFARIIRFQRAANAASSKINWSAIAADAGYYDQAHMISEFRALVGTTPERFMRRVSSHRW
jgi:AraC-like DNA-binding protein